MTLKKFSTEIKRLGGTLDLEGTEFNTNNGWGFGGGYGTEHAGRVKDVDFVLRKGRACFRHMDEEPFSNVRLKQADRTKFTPEMFLKLVAQPDCSSENLQRAFEAWWQLQYGRKRR